MCLYMDSTKEMKIVNIYIEITHSLIPSENGEILG